MYVIVALDNRKPCSFANYMVVILPWPLTGTVLYLGIHWHHSSPELQVRPGSNVVSDLDQTGGAASWRVSLASTRFIGIFLAV